MFPLSFEVACIFQIIVIKSGLEVDPIKKLSLEFNELTRKNFKKYI